MEDGAGATRPSAADLGQNPNLVGRRERSPATAGREKITGLNVQVLPNRVYFLAIGCNGAVRVTGTGNATRGAASGPIGLIIV